jgi:excisionase family DNA binding protein
VRTSARPRALAAGSDFVEALVRLVEDEIAERLNGEPGEPERKWITVEEAAVRLDCSRKAIRARAARGRLESRHQGRRLYILAASVDAL